MPKWLGRLAKQLEDKVIIGNDFINTSFARALFTGQAQRIRVTQSQKRKHEQAIWQRRFWEHEIRDQMDFEKHVAYIHYNPVKHGLVNHVVDWPYSTFHRYVENGIYSNDWAGSSEILHHDL